MTLKSHRNLTTCKKVLIIFAALVLFAPGAFALHVEFDDYYIDYELIDFVKMEKEADSFFVKASLSEDKTEREEFFEAAQSRYYQLADYNQKEIKYPMQLARIYDHKKHDRLAKGYFFRALNLDNDDPYVSFYFGDFYFTRTDYKRALKRYLHAHRNGLQNRYKLNYNIAIIYEKFGDLVSAKKFYSACAAADPSSPELRNKVQAIDGLNYENSEYYYFIRGKSEK